MSSSARVLFSCRDPGAAGHLLPLLTAFRNDVRFEVTVAASGAGLAALQMNGESPVPFSLPDGADHIALGADQAVLLAAASRLISDVQPDVIFTCLSTHGIGIDEGLLASAHGIPTFIFQDYWGDLNLELGVLATHHLVLDEYAVVVTKQRWGIDAVAVGSPKHARYIELDVGRLRDESRARLGVLTDRVVIGFFDQSPDIPGLDDAFSDLVVTLARMTPRPHLLVRQHPKFPQAVSGHLRKARLSGIECTDASDWATVEEVLASCDVVTTAFSSCGLDHAYLSAYSAEPLGTVVYLATNDPLRRAILDATGLEYPAAVNRGLGTAVWNSASMLPVIREALSTSERWRYFNAAQALQSEDPCAAIATLVASAVDL